MNVLSGGLVAVCAALAGAVLGCVPGVHAYHVLGLATVLMQAGVGVGEGVAPWLLTTCGLASGVAAFSVTAGLPAALLASPEESAAFAVYPARCLVREGRGPEAAAAMAAGALMAAGGVGGVMVLAGARLLPVVTRVLRPHQYWLVAAVTLFVLLMVCFAPTVDGGRASVRRRPILWAMGAGLVTFGLAGMLGCLLIFGPPYSAPSRLAGLVPAFVGLYGAPWLLRMLTGGVPAVPPQRQSGLPVSRRVLHGALAGVVGGGVAALLSGLSAGVGGWLASYATRTRDDAEVLAAQGAARMTFYLSAVVLLLGGGMPWLHRGTTVGAAWPPHAAWGYLPMMGGVASLLGAVVAAALLKRFAEVFVRVGSSMRAPAVPVLAGGCLLATAGVVGGWWGCAVAVVAAGIGLMPVCFGASRAACLAVVLVPATCDLAGWGRTMTAWFGVGG